MTDTLGPHSMFAASSVPPVPAIPAASSSKPPMKHVVEDLLSAIEEEQPMNFDQHVNG